MKGGKNGVKGSSFSSYRLAILELYAKMSKFYLYPNYNDQSLFHRSIVRAASSPIDSLIHRRF